MTAKTTTIKAPAGKAKAAGAEPVNYLTTSRGFLSWALTLDHKRIGLMYLAGISVMFLLGGIFALLIRTELLTPETDQLFSADTYNRFFSAHGIIMVFLVIIPGIPAALGNFALPILLGAKDVAFPKLNLVSFYLWVSGALFASWALVHGSIDTGWTFYTPYSTTTNTNVTMAATAAFILGFSSIFTGLNFVVTIHKMRAPGMDWFKMPLSVWALYATAIIQVLATPVIGITLLLLILERTLKIGIFDPALGGDPVLFQHFFWFYSHPAVYIMILPGMGLISELIPPFSRKHIFGYRNICFSSIAIAIFGFIVWGHHMFTSGQSALTNAVFSALTFSVSLPSAVKVFNWVATMYKGSIRMAAPMVYAVGFIFIFGIGGLTGLFLATLSTDIHLHDTYFVVAHFHYVMMGSALIAFFGGLFYWWPKMTGRMYNSKMAEIGAWMVVVGFNVTFFPQFIMGSHGMPRRYAHYPEMYYPEHLWSTIGSYLLASGLLLEAISLIHSLFRGRKAPANPWGSNTLEWHTTSPPPEFNFDETPEVGDPYDYSRLVWDPSIGGWIEKPRDPQQSPSPAPAGH